MAIYHLSAKPVQRSKGRSVTSAIAYRAACVIEDKRTGLKYDYTKKKGVIHSEIIVPYGIRRPERNELWNWAELTERRKDACTGREYEVNLPYELTDEQRIVLCQDFSKYLCQTHGIAVDFSIHKPTEKDIKEGADPRNYHAHIMTTTRKINDEGLTDKADIEKAGRKRKKDLEATRKAWADFANKHLQMAGFRERIDHRSFIDRGSNRKPTIKMGWESTTAERNGIRTIKGDINRQIKDDNRKISKLSKELPRLNIQRSGEILDEQIANYKRQQQHEKQLELERLEREKQAQRELEKQRQEQQRLDEIARRKQLELERLEREKQVQRELEKQRKEQQRLDEIARQKQLELERLEREKQVQRELEKQRKEQQRLDEIARQKQLELERLEREKQVQRELEKQRKEQQRLDEIAQQKQLELERDRQFSINRLARSLPLTKAEKGYDFENSNIVYDEFLKLYKPMPNEQFQLRKKLNSQDGKNLSRAIAVYPNGLMSVHRFHRTLRGDIERTKQFFEISNIANFNDYTNKLEFKDIGVSLDVAKDIQFWVTDSIEASEQYKRQPPQPPAPKPNTLEQPKAEPTHHTPKPRF